MFDIIREEIFQTVDNFDRNDWNEYTYAWDIKKKKLNLHLLCAFNHQFGFNIKLDFYIIAIGNYGSELESN